MKSHRIHEKRVSREMVIESPSGLDHRRVIDDLLECWFCGGDWAGSGLERNGISEFRDLL